MALFKFKDDAFFLGTVREVDTRKVSIHVKSDTDLTQLSRFLKKRSIFSGLCAQSLHAK